MPAKASLMFSTSWEKQFIRYGVLLNRLKSGLDNVSFCAIKDRTHPFREFRLLAIDLPLDTMS